MADLSDLILGERRRAQPFGAVKGEVAEYDDGELFVVIPDYDPQIRFGPCPFVGPADPERGDACLVIFDDEREPWALIPNG